MSVVEPAAHGTDFVIELVPSELGRTIFSENV